MAETQAQAHGGPPLASRLHVAVWARLAAGIVVAVLGTLLLVKVVGSSAGAHGATQLTPTPPSVLEEVTSIPASVYDAVGVRSAAVPVVAPHVLGDTPTLLTHAAGGETPVVLFVGAEYCSFCAAERWPLVAALSRFGTFRSLNDVQSSSTGFAPNTPTFSFYGADYHSRYLSFRPFEVADDVLGRDGYGRLMTVPATVHAVEHRLDPTSTLPFVDVGGLADVPEAALSPITFVGVSRDQVAGALGDPTNPVTRSIVASANYLTAAVCRADGERPGAVCRSPGVLAADAALRLPA